ncbi:hypothetical protein GWK74_01915 [Candidatus Saccharibacteria bacterium oral taxon 488]|jgi:hypothetical protein|nr:hypothetical protein GWK74_01915 [Candidatus Saccharibacteria bacterium oral taxon 488]
MGIHDRLPTSTAKTPETIATIMEGYQSRLDDIFAQAKDALGDPEIHESREVTINNLKRMTALILYARHRIPTDEITKNMNEAIEGFVCDRDTDGKLIEGTLNNTMLQLIVDIHEAKDRAKRKNRHWKDQWSNDIKQLGMIAAVRVSALTDEPPLTVDDH